MKVDYCGCCCVGLLNGPQFKRNASYDAAVHRAIDLYRKVGLDALHGPQAPREQALAAFKEAMDKGCDDPLIWCLYGIVYGKMRQSPVPNTPPLEGRLLGLEFSKYPYGAKLLVLVRSFWLDEAPGPREWGLALTSLKEVAKSPDVPPGELYNLTLYIYQGSRRMRQPWGKGMAFADAFFDAFHDDPGAMSLKAAALVDQAWDGDGDARNLPAAQRLCEKAAELDPADSRPPTLMVTVLMRQGAAPQEIDPWFQKAMDADPDNLDVCLRKLRYLEQLGDPGSEQMIEFGRRCLATRNWRGGIPMVLVNAREWLAEESPDRKQYLSRPEVWEDLRAVYEGGLLNFPNDAAHRSEYVKYAATCDHWDVVKRETDRMGDHPDLAVFQSLTSYNYLRKKASRLASTPAPARP